MTHGILPLHKGVRGSGPDEGQGQGEGGGGGGEAKQRGGGDTSAVIDGEGHSFLIQVLLCVCARAHVRTYEILHYP